MFGNELGAGFSKRFANTSLVIAQSPLLTGRRIAARPRIIRSGPGTAPAGSGTRNLIVIMT